MTNTLTTDVKTIEQINSLEEVGADIVKFLVEMKIQQNVLKKLLRR